MNLIENLGLIYYLLPFIFVAKNKLGLTLSVLFGSKNYRIKLKDNSVVRFASSQFDTMLSFLAILTYATSYSITSDRKLEVSFDMMKNKFTIPLDNLTIEDENLLLTLFGGLRHGADFITENEVSNQRRYRDKTFRITKKDGKQIIETSNGIKFYMDSIHPGNTIVEAFVQDIHLVNSKDDWNGKIVLDVGAECGDTPLYYASKGATVYAFEPMKAHFDAMMRNLSLNPELSKRITPINAAIGKDGTLKFYHSDRADIAETSSFVYNAHGEDVKVFEVKGYSIRTAIKEFNIDHVDLLKMDCKGCEFFLTEDDLRNVNKIKIEYEAFPYVGHSLENLLKVIKNMNFDYVLYRINPNRDKFSNKDSGHLYGEKTK
jgi:FkbM family methyltransferase